MISGFKKIHLRISELLYDKEKAADIHTKKLESLKNIHKTVQNISRCILYQIQLTEPDL